jgi:hypothetical protein
MRKKLLVMVVSPDEQIGSLTSGPTSGTGKSAGRNFTNQGKTVYHMTSKETPPFL